MKAAPTTPLRSLRRRASAVSKGGLLLALCLVAACDAPLQSDSEKQKGAAASPSPAASAGVSPSATAEPVPTPSAVPKVPATPTVTVPSLTPAPVPKGPVFGGDVSWPQCPKGMGIPEKRSEGIPMPTAAAKFIIIGLTNGPGFTVNPCVADQLRFAKQRKMLTSAYSVVSSPNRFTPADAGRKGPFDGGTKLGSLANIGYQQARFNIATMKRVGFQTPFVWIDVEPVPTFVWSSDKQANAAVVRGAARGYTDAGYAIGVYSTPYLWDIVVGDLALRIPEWRAAGQTSRAEALRRCGPDWVIQGGRAVIGQWVATGRDLNVTCPGANTQLARLFHQY